MVAKKFKNLLSLCLLGCFVSSAAYAGQVSIYGYLNTGIAVKKSKTTPTTASLTSNDEGATRIVIAGREEINSDYTAGFTLVDSFYMDNGVAFNPTTEAFLFTDLYMITPIGRFGAGKMAGFGTVAGPKAEWLEMDPFSGVYWDAGIQSAYDVVWAEVESNALYYTSPTIGGFRLGLMFSFNGTTEDNGGKFSQNTQYYEAFGAYENEVLKVKLDVMTYHYGSDNMYKGMDQPLWTKLAVKYNLTPDTKLYAGIGYGRNQVHYNAESYMVNPTFSGYSGRGIDNYSTNIGIRQRAGSGDIIAQYLFQIGKNHNSAYADERNKFSRHSFGLGYEYYLSKRTTIYSAATYSFSTGTLKGTEIDRRWMLLLGMGHYF